MSWINTSTRIPLGANRRTDGAWEFSVWAPKRQKVAVHLLGPRETFHHHGQGCMRLPKCSSK